MPFRDTPVYKLAEKVIRLGQNEDLIFQEVMNNQTIIDLVEFLQTEAQMGTQNVDSKGEPLFNTLTGRGTYSIFDPKGRGGEPYKLFDTGAFWESTKVTVLPGQILITMNPLKDNDNLFEIYGKDIEGLTTESIQILQRESLRAHINFLRRELTNV